MALALSRPSSMSLFSSMAATSVFAQSLRQRAWSIIPLLPQLQGEPSFRPIKPPRLPPQTSSTTTTALSLPLLAQPLLPTLPSLQPLSQLSQFLNGLLPQLVPQKLLDALSGLVFAVPKKKTSHSKKRHRQLAGKALKDVTSLNKCPGCGRVKRMNRLCNYCMKEIWAMYNNLDEPSFKSEDDGKEVFAKIERLRFGRGRDARKTKRKENRWAVKMEPHWANSKRQRGPQMHEDREDSSHGKMSRRTRLPGWRPSIKAIRAVNPQKPVKKERKPTTREMKVKAKVEKRERNKEKKKEKEKRKTKQ